MKVSVVHLISTRLSNDYKNVFDNWSTADEYLTKLKTSGASYVTTLQSPRSIIQKTDGCIITVPNPFLTVRNCNYCCLETEAGTKYFYFIVDAQSNNDISESPSTTITLEWDAWANNYLTIRSSIISDRNFIKRRTYQSFYKPSIDQYHYYPMPYTVDSNLETHASMYQDFTILHRYQVLWMRVRFSSESTVKWFRRNNDEFVEMDSSKGGCIKSQGITPILFVPYGYYDNFEDKFYSTTDCVFGVNGVSTTFTNRNLYENLSVLSIDLTYNTPVEYDIDINFDGTVRYVSITSNYMNAGKVQFESGNISVDINGVISFSNVPRYLTYTAPLPHYSFDSDITKGDTSYSSRVAICSATKTYPYRFLSVNIGTEVHPIVPLVGQGLVKIDTSNDDTTSLKYKIYNDKEGNVRNPTLKYTQAPLIISKDSLQSYLNSNYYTALFHSAALSTKTMTNTMFSLVKPRFNSAGGIVDNIFDEIQYKAKITGIDKQFDDVRIPSNIGSDDTFYLDRAFVNDNIIYDYVALESIVENVHKYGVNINRTESVKINYHYDFDHIITEDCSLPYVLNMHDRKIIEKAYNNGITRWHMDSSNTSMIMSFNTNIVNIPLELEELL